MTVRIGFSAALVKQVRNVKRDKTHNRYFPTFDALVQAVEDGLSSLPGQPTAVKRLMGSYLEEQAACPQAA